MGKAADAFGPCQRQAVGRGAMGMVATDGVLGTSLKGWRIGERT